MGTVQGKDVTLYIHHDPVTPYPGTADEAARVVTLLEAIYAGGGGTLTRESSEYGFRWGAITDRYDHPVLELNEAQCQWAAEWLRLRDQPRVEAVERRELARLLAKYGDSP